MEFLSNKPLLITDTILRDAHQSQAATRMTLEDMLPACEVLDSIGYYSLECWGGAIYLFKLNGEKPLLNDFSVMLPQQKEAAKEEAKK